MRQFKEDSQGRTALDRSGSSTAGVALNGPGQPSVNSNCGGSEGSQPYAAALVSRSGLLLEGLARLLGNTGFEVVAMSGDLDQLVLPALGQYRSLVVIVDGRELELALGHVRSLRAQHEGFRIAVILAELHWTHTLSFFEAGAHVCFPETVAAEMFLKSLELVILQKTLPPATMPAFSPLTPPSSASQEMPAPTMAGATLRLSAQEDQILRRIAEGDSNKVIARALGIADTTVKVHVRGILRKLGVNNRTQAAMWASRHVLEGQPSSTPAQITAKPASSPE